MLSKQEFRIILLHEFKLGHNAAEATRNIIKAWGEKPLQSVQYVVGLKNFVPAIPASDIDNDQLRAIIEADSCKTTREIAEELKVHH